MVFNLIQYNFLIVINIVFLLVFLQTNTVFEKEINRRFFISILLLMVLSVTENIEYVLSLRPDPTMARTIVAMLGYMIRPWTIYVLILILKYNTHKERLIVAVPAIINMLVELSAPFCGIAFYFNEANKFTRGPLAYTPHICSAIYLVMILILSARFFRERNYMEAGVVLTIVIVCVIATVLESIWDHQGLLRGASTLSITFFYLFFCAQSFKRDALTKVLNRHCFYRDSKKYHGKLNVVMSIDLNDLKKINDTGGHAAGDKAISTTAECVRKSLIKGCVLYRTGGDEFMVLCQKNLVTPEQCKDIIANIKKEMEQTPYRCSVGMAEFKQGESFDAVCARADEAMYQEKQKYKYEL